MQLDCLFGILSNGIYLPVGSPSLPEFVARHFFAASDGDIDLQCSNPAPVSNPLANRPVSALELHTALAYLTGNSTSGPISRIGILLADQYESYPQALGVMFDRGFSTPDDPNLASVFTGNPREGCAVFLGAISKLRGRDDTRSEILFTAAHELGHVFNLQHDDASLDFMTPSSQQSVYDVTAYHFSPEQQAWLAQCSTNPSVRPGGLPFMNLGTFGNINMPPSMLTGAGTFGLELALDCRPREVWRFEPLQLELALQWLGDPRRSIEVPDELDPGHRRFRLFIEDPLGERRLYRPPIFVCSPRVTRRITAASPLRRDIPVFAQAGGYTFRTAGVHRIYAEFRLDSGVVRSNVLEVLIKPERGTTHAERQLSDPRVANLLFHREDFSDGMGIAALADFIDTHPTATCAGEIHYTLARSGLARCRHIGKRSATLRRVAGDRLKRALDTGELGAHRERKATFLLNDLLGSSQNAIARRRSLKRK